MLTQINKLMERSLESQECDLEQNGDCEGMMQLCRRVWHNVMNSIITQDAGTFALSCIYILLFIYLNLFSWAPFSAGITSL